MTMFRYEKEMIPVLKSSLSKKFNTNYFATEFNTGNGIADLVFTTEISNESLFFNDYGLMSLFVKYFNGKQKLNKTLLFEICNDKIKLKKLLYYLEKSNFIETYKNDIKQTRKYEAHTHNLISIEAKLKDWKSGFYQALRYQFYSHKTFLAFPKSYIHRVNIDLLKQHHIGLISVDQEKTTIILNPPIIKPKDIISYFILAENFAQNFKTKQTSH